VVDFVPYWGLFDHTPSGRDLLVGAEVDDRIDHAAHVRTDVHGVVATERVHVERVHTRFAAADDQPRDQPGGLKLRDRADDLDADSTVGAVLDDRVGRAVSDAGAACPAQLDRRGLHVGAAEVAHRDRVGAPERAQVSVSMPSMSMVTAPTSRNRRTRDP
jgi:hypothetical protein